MRPWVPQVLTGCAEAEEKSLRERHIKRNAGRETTAPLNNRKGNAEEGAPRLVMYQKLLKEFQTCRVLVLSSFLLTLYKLLEEYIESAMELHLLDDPPNNETPWAPDFLTRMLPSLQNLNSIISRVDTVRSSTRRTQTPPNDSSAIGLTSPNFLLTFIENLKDSLESIQSTSTTTNQCEGNSNEQNRPESRSSQILVPPPPPTFHDSPATPTYHQFSAPPIYHHSQAPPVRPRHISPLLAPPMRGASISRASRPPRPEQGTPPRPYRNSRWHRPPHRHRSPKYEPYYQRHHN